MKCWFRFAVYLSVILWISVSEAGSYEDFFRAVNRDDAAVVSGLLARGFDPNSPDERGQVALFLAMRENAPKVAAALLASPATQVDAANAAGETPLMMAALKGRAHWVQRLVERGAAVDRSGWTALHYAAIGPAPMLVTMLLDRGARVDAPSPNHSTPLMLAARYGSEQAVDLLLARGADRRLRNDQGLDAADFARQAGRAALAARLARAPD